MLVTQSAIPLSCQVERLILLSWQNKNYVCFKVCSVPVQKKEAAHARAKNLESDFPVSHCHSPLSHGTIWLVFVCQDRCQKTESQEARTSLVSN